MVTPNSQLFILYFLHVLRLRGHDPNKGCLPLAYLFMCMLKPQNNKH
jgi:hypothetical protein